MNFRAKTSNTSCFKPLLQHPLGEVPLPLTQRNHPELQDSSLQIVSLQASNNKKPVSRIIKIHFKALLQP